MKYIEWQILRQPDGTAQVRGDHYLYSAVYGATKTKQEVYQFKSHDWAKREISQVKEDWEYAW